MKKKGLVLLAIILMMSIALVGCSSPQDVADSGQGNVAQQITPMEGPTEYPLTIQTYNFEKEPIEVTFEEAPQKVVAVYQNSIELLLALGLEDRIVAAAGLDDPVKAQWQEGFAKVNYLEEFAPSKEVVLMQEPDFILSWKSYFGEKMLGDVDYWIDRGTNTYIMKNSGIATERTIENECEDILIIGRIFDVNNQAKAMVDAINAEVESVTKAVAGQESQNVAVIQFGSENIRSFGKSTLAGDMVTKLGGKLVTEEDTSIGKEELINANPDAIFITYMERGDSTVAGKELAKIMDSPEYASLDAVKNKRVYTIPLGEIYASGPRTIDGIQSFVRGLYPYLDEAK